MGWSPGNEIKPFAGNYPIHLVEVMDNKLLFKNADNEDLFQLLNLIYNSSLGKKERMQKEQDFETDRHGNLKNMAQKKLLTQDYSRISKNL